MIGRHVETTRRGKSRAPPTARRAADAGRGPDRCRAACKAISFALRRGEVLGVTGLAGSGLGELAKAMFGAIGARSDSGRVDRRRQCRCRRATRRLRLPPASRCSPAIACARAFFRISRWSENICLPILSRFAGLARACSTGATMDRDRRSATSRGCASGRPGPLALARQLSGGNQQKVLFAKWLETRPRVFVMDEPTIGIDVGSKAEIRGIIDEIAATGVGIVLVTTELEELVSLCDRVLVMFRGAIVAELTGAAIERAAILHASAGGERMAVPA